MSTPFLSDSPPARRRRALFLSGGAAVSTLLATPAFAEGTRAGSLINNTATATFDNGDTPTTVNSNTVTLKVDEVLDVAVAAQGGGDATVAAGSTGNVRSFTLTNTGNGAEAFVLSAIGQVGGNQFDPTVTSIAVDLNGNGVYEAGVDQVIADGGSTAAIDADAAITVFVISSAPAGATDGQQGDVQLKAVAQTGSGSPGTAFAGRGAGGGDALVGASTASRTAESGFVISRASVRFEKTAVVLDSYGGARAVPGSIVTYRLTATIDGSGSLAGLRVQDAIPTGTSYVAGSLRQDNSALTDAADGDAGTGGASGIDVSLGTVAAGATRLTEFKVKID